MYHFFNIKLILFVLSLSIDTAIVSIGLGISGIGKKYYLRLGISFAVFEGLMPLIGFLAGNLVSGILGSITSYLGIILLFGMSIWMFKESFKDNDKKLHIHTWKGLMLTSLAVSMDELAVGFTMGTLGFPIIPVVILTASQAFVITFLGIFFGNIIGEKFIKRGEILTAVILFALAVLLLVEKLLHIGFK